MRSPLHVAVAIALVVSAGAAPAGFSPSQVSGDAVAPVAELLRAIGGFTPRDIATLQRGEPLARTLNTDKREIAVMGAVRIRSSRDRLVSRYRDVSNLRKSDLVLQVGTFGGTPAPADLAALAPTPYDLDAPKSCVPGDCAVRLSADAIGRMRKAVTWSAPNARQQSADAWRQTLADIALAYREDGDAGLPAYANKKEPLSVSAEMQAAYAGFDFLPRLSPDFFAYIREYPRRQLPGVEEVLYWSVTDFGPRPVMGLTHQVMHAPAAGPTLIASKRIYAAHYIDAGLGVTIAMDDGAGGFYMTILERIRTRSLTGIMRAPVRSIVHGRTREGLEKALRASKRALESTS